MTNTLTIAGACVKVTCADQLSAQAEWLLALISRVAHARGPRFIREGVHIEAGWSMLTLARGGEGYVVCEPDFSADPRTAIRPDVTCTLWVQAQQNDVVQRLNVIGVAAKYSDKVVCAKGCLAEKHVFLKRSEPSRGDTGWYIGPVAEADGVREYDGLYVYQLLHIRPSLLRVLSLPPGYLAVFADDRIDAIVDPHDRKVLADALPPGKSR